jgi:hypothetical protein
MKKLSSTLFLFVISVLVLSSSLAYSGQSVYGSQYPNGRPTDWESPAGSTQLVSSAQSVKVQQDPGAAGGGEGKPTDWESPERFINFQQRPFPTSHLQLLVNHVEVIFNLIAWWF